jgi:hypothetical protein
MRARLVIVLLGPVVATAGLAGCIQGAFFPAEVPTLASGWSKDEDSSEGGQRGVEPIVRARYQVNAYEQTAAPPGALCDGCGARAAECGGLRVVAVVAATDGADGDLARDLAAFASSRLAAHEVPRAFAIVPELPTTPSGKIRRDEAARLAAEAIVREPSVVA